MHKLMGCLLGATLVLGMTFSAAAEDKPAKKGRMSGNVQSISKDKNEVALRKSNATADQIVIISSSTRLNMQAATNATTTPAKFEDIKERLYMTCTGTYSGVKLAADSCTIAPTKER